MTIPKEVPEPAPWADLLTIRQAAVRLGVGRATVYRMISDGRLARVHLGAGARIPTKDVDRLLAEIGATQGD